MEILITGYREISLCDQSCCSAPMPFRRITLETNPVDRLTSLIPKIENNQWLSCSSFSDASLISVKQSNGQYLLMLSECDNTDRMVPKKKLV